MKFALFMLVVLQAPCSQSFSPPVERQIARSRSGDAMPRVICSGRRMRAIFGPEVQDSLRVKVVNDASGISVPVPTAREQCGVKGAREKDGVSFYSRYDSCYAHIEEDSVVVVLGVQLITGGQRYRVNISCPLQKSHIPKPHSNTSPEKCNIQKAFRAACGPPGVSSGACQKLGCCYNHQDSACYYRMNACSLDGHFVFSVKATDSYPPLNPSSLVIRGQPQCTPVTSTSDTAIFVFAVTACGAQMQVMGAVVTYGVEVVEELKDSKTQRRQSAFRQPIQCQYTGSALLRTELLSLDPTNPPPASALGAFQVQMRIATDESFSSFVPRDELPLTLLLRQPVHVEVSISPPSLDPSLSLSVRDCFAYPASGHSMWTLLYDGCPNYLDSVQSSIPAGDADGTAAPSQVRRFDVKTFAFVDPETGKPSMEELYFYCWVEICTEGAECEQRCSMPSSEGERERREAGAGRLSQLVTLGPVLLAYASGVVCVCSLTAIFSSTLFFLLILVWWRKRKRKRSQRENQEQVQKC